MLMFTIADERSQLSRFAVIEVQRPADNHVAVRRRGIFLFRLTTPIPEQL